MCTYPRDLLLVNSAQIYCPLLSGKGWKVQCGIKERPCELMWKQYSESRLYKMMVVIGSDLKWFPKWFHCNLHIFKDLFLWYFDP